MVYLKCFELENIRKFHLMHIIQLFYLALINNISVSMYTLTKSADIDKLSVIFQSS